MKVNRRLKANPVERGKGKWFKPARYPRTVFVCPLCYLPETVHIYEVECDCWDDPKESE